MRPPSWTGSAEPVDYLSAGPVTPTPTKPGRPGTGLGVHQPGRRPGPPAGVGDGGGLTRGVPSMVAAGARHFVVVRWLTEAADPEAAARQLRRAIDAELATAEGR